MAKGESMICSFCMLDLPRSNYHRNSENPLYKRLMGRFPLERAFSFLLFRKKGKVQQLLHALKYHNKPELGQILGRVYGHDLVKDGIQNPVDLIIPVPLHPSRKKKRGYNQSEEFAKGLSEALKIELNTSVVYRAIQTETQTRKTKLKRWQNVREVFAVSNNALVEGKHVLLVDDVITTGATIEACAQKLIQSKCKAISVASIAYAQESL